MKDPDCEKGRTEGTEAATARASAHAPTSKESIEQFFRCDLLVKRSTSCSAG